MTLRIALRPFLVVLAAATAGSAAAPHAPSLALSSHKDSYNLGEPVVIRTILAAPVQPEGIALRQKSYSLRRPYAGFVLLMRLEGASEVCWTDRNYDLGSVPPSHHHAYSGDQYLPGHWRSLERYQRVDMLVLDRPGKYSIKAGLRHTDGFQLLSKEITIEVKQPEKPDSVVAYLQGEKLRDLGYLLCDLHYLQGSSSIGGDTRMSREELHKIAPNIIEKCRDSMFYEHVIYAAILIHFHEMAGNGNWTLRDPEIIALAEEFIRVRRDSWLWPHVCRILVHKYIDERTPEGNTKAIDLGEEGLLMDPIPTVLINGPREIRTRVRDLKRKRLAEKRKKTRRPR